MYSIYPRSLWKRCQASRCSLGLGKALNSVYTATRNHKTIHEAALMCSRRRDRGRVWRVCKEQARHIWAWRRAHVWTCIIIRNSIGRAVCIKWNCTVHAQKCRKQILHQSLQLKNKWTARCGGTNKCIVTQCKAAHEMVLNTVQFHNSCVNRILWSRTDQRNLWTNYAVKAKTEEKGEELCKAGLKKPSRRVFKTDSVNKLNQRTI